MSGTKGSLRNSVVFVSESELVRTRGEAARHQSHRVTRPCRLSPLSLALHLSVTTSSPQGTERKFITTARAAARRQVGLRPGGARRGQGGQAGQAASGRTSTLEEGAWIAAPWPPPPRGPPSRRRPLTRKAETNDRACGLRLAGGSPAAQQQAAGWGWPSQPSPLRRRAREPLPAPCRRHPGDGPLPRRRPPCGTCAAPGPAC